MSGIGCAADYRTALYLNHDPMTSDNVNIGMLDQNGKKSVSKMSFLNFHDKLIRHFNIAFKRNALEWPKRNQKKQRYI